MEENTNVSETIVTPNQTQQAKTYTEEEYNKAIQSAKSTAKYEIMQSLNIDSVDDFKTLRSDFESSKKSNDETKAKYDALSKEFTTYKEQSIAKLCGVSDDKIKDFDAIVRSRIDAEHTYEDVAKIVADEYFKKPTTPTMAVPTTDQAPPSPKYNTFGW